MSRIKSEYIVSAIMLVVLAAMGANAGGPLFMWNKEQRLPYRWDVSTPVRVYTDNGPFEIIPPQYTPIPNEVADAAVAFSIGQWTDVETSSFQAEVVGDFASIGLPDVNNAATAAQVIGTDNGGGVHIIYDADGKVMRDFLGTPSNVLGVAMPEVADETTGEITESWVVLNSQARWVGDDQLANFRAVITHEFGHAINLAHSQTNGAIFLKNDAKGPASCATLPYSTTVTKNDMETMHPFLNVRPTTGTGLQMSTVDLSEDKAAVSNLYPVEGYQGTHGSITGRILQTDGETGITGINVIARNLDNPYMDAVSAMSGDYTRVETGDDGTYKISGLTPGARYALYTDMIVDGGFPTEQPLYMPEGEEFFNGQNESGDGLTDDRCHVSPITAEAGLTTQADITLNSVKGAPKFKPMVGSITPMTISADGSIIGGNIVGGGIFRYTEAEGYLALNDAANSAGTMSRDGSAFTSETLNAENKRVASVLVYPGGSWLQLPFPAMEAPMTISPSDYYSASWGVADGGRAVAGHILVDTNGPLPGQSRRARPFVWTPEGGSKLLPAPADAGHARPNGISADGTTILGWYDFPTLPYRYGARWVNGSFIPFSTPELTVGEASRSTPDGKVILGMNAGPRKEAWYWTQEKGVQLLGRLGAIGTSSANAVSDDGQVIAGFGGSIAQFPGDVSGHRAFLWTPVLGFVDLENFLKAQGTSFEGWILNSATSVTADGTRFIGVGYGPRGQAGWMMDMQYVNICHAPPGNPGNTQSINVPFRGNMDDHLKHGDTIGVCQGS